MKKFLLLVAVIGCVNIAAAQDKPHLYNPAADAKADIAAAVKRASATHKNVLLQIGGNWCVWCIRFNDLVTKNDTLNNYLTKNYEVVHVNYSPENKNEKLLAELGYPQRFGFPVFIVLDGKGNRLHTQNSSYLEEGKGHSKAKVLEFLESWSPSALDPKNYVEKAK
ncbi:thioredoxin family protein [Mucilaginibacter terrenus]|uniref:Thioredoxin family protein n=1 Tax=Mucilaginibacter terrenus TaxID=2482727 RepID=A0A3E2NLA2_9SPHI|nr:thioredoxin family protein [Mucilaginibacter terrenus]RFZ81751.1 thioredoxin family protein [Mucilaginibacter terrenus]